MGPRDQLGSYSSTSRRLVRADSGLDQSGGGGGYGSVCGQEVINKLVLGGW